MIGAFTAVAALIGAVGGLVAGIASVIGAVNAFRGKKAATETRDLLQTVVIQQLKQHQEVHTHVHVAGAVTAGPGLPPQSVTFPVGEVPPPASNVLPEGEALEQVPPAPVQQQPEE